MPLCTAVSGRPSSEDTITQNNLYHQYLWNRSPPSVEFEILHTRFEQVVCNELFGGPRHGSGMLPSALLFSIVKVSHSHKSTY